MLPAQGWRASFAAAWQDGRDPKTRWVSTVRIEDHNLDPPVIAWDDEGRALIVDPRKARLVVAADQEGFRGLYYTLTTKQPVYRSQ